MLTSEPLFDLDEPAIDRPGHAVLVRRAVLWLRGLHKCSVVFAEMTAAPGYFPDALGWYMGFSIMVECKSSRSDFLADKRKGILDNPDGFPGEERWYLTSPGIVKPGEVPDGWYLAETTGKTVRIVTHPPCWPSSIAWNPAWGKEPDPRNSPGMWRRERNAARAACGVPYLLSAVRRHECGVRWLASEARFESINRRNRREADEARTEEGG